MSEKITLPVELVPTLRAGARQRLAWHAERAGFVLGLTDDERVVQMVLGALDRARALFDEASAPEAGDLELDLGAWPGSLTAALVWQHAQELTRVEREAANGSRPKSGVLPELEAFIAELSHRLVGMHQEGALSIAVRGSAG
jgi:hypothetical protein